MPLVEIVMTPQTVRTGDVVAVNVGGVREIEWSGKLVRTAIWKTPVADRVQVRGVNVDRDDQGDRRVHGGPDKAVYAYSIEDYEWWSERLERDLTPGTFGENLTTRGVDISAAVIGQRWKFDDLWLEVSQPRLPCFKLGIRMDDPSFVDLFKRAARFGTYLRIIEPGSVASGDEFQVGEPPGHGLTITEIGEGYPKGDSSLHDRMRAVSELPDGWRRWAERALLRPTSQAP